MLQIEKSSRLGAFAPLMAHFRLPLYRNAYALIFNDGMTGLLGLLYWALAARYYPAEQVGRDAAAISTMMALAGLAYVNLKGAMIRLLPTAGRLAPKLIGYAYLLSLTLALLIGALFIVGYQRWVVGQNFLDESRFFTWWFLGSVLGWSVFGLQDNILTGLRQTFWIPLENISFGIAKILLLWLLAAWWPERGVFLSWTAPIVLFIAVISWLIFRRLLPRHVQKHGGQSLALTPRQLAQFVAGDYVGTLFWVITTMSLPLLVISQAGAAANAYFYLAWTVAFPLHLVSSNMAASLTVEGALNEAQTRHYVRRAFVQILRLLAAPVLIIQLGAPYLLQLFGQAYSDEGAMLLRLLVLAAVPYSVNAIFLGKARIRQQVRAVLLTQGAICILVLSTSYLLIQLYGLTGVGIAWLVSHSVIAAGLLIQSYAVLKVRD